MSGFNLRRFRAKQSQSAQHYTLEWCSNLHHSAVRRRRVHGGTCCGSDIPGHSQPRSETAGTASSNHLARDKAMLRRRKRVYEASEVCERRRPTPTVRAWFPEVLGTSRGVEAS